MMRYRPPNGTAGLARSLVSGYSRVPFPPARTKASTRTCMGPIVARDWGKEQSRPFPATRRKCELPALFRRPTSMVLRNRHVPVEITGRVNSDADNLASGVDGASSGQIQSRVGGDERVEVDQILAQPYERSRVEICVQRNSHDLALVINANGRAVHVSRNGPEVLHPTSLVPYEAVKAGVTL